MAAEEEAGQAARRGSRIRVRWNVFAILFALCFMAYMQRTSLGVAADRMLPDLGLTNTELGWLQTAFMVIYTGCQIPSGVVSEILGARRVVAMIGILVVAATIATVALPMVLAGATLLAALLLARAVMGFMQAPIFPVTAGVIEAWYPVGKWSFPMGLLSTGSNIGSAVAQPLVAQLMEATSWQTALVVSSAPMALVSVLWWFYSRDRAADHPGVSPEELAELSADTADRERPTVTLRQVLGLLASRDILVMSVSYMLMNYVFYLLTFWVFLYLVQQRHMDVLQSGWLAALPYLAAALGAGVGGQWGDMLRRRYGPVWGFRLIPLVALPASGVALIGAVEADGALAVIAALCLAFFALETAEGPFWAATIEIAQGNATIGSAVLNTGGNLGGTLGQPLVGWLSANGHWNAAFVTGAVCTLLAAGLWFAVDARRRVESVSG